MTAVLFGLGGVLIDSEDHWYDAQMRFLRKVVSKWTKNDLAQTVGMDLRELHEFLLAKDAHITYEKLKETYDKLDALVYEKRCGLRPGVPELLDRLRREGITMAIATSTRRHNIEAVIKRFNLDEYINVWTCKDDVWASKPHPNIFLHTARLLHVTPKECVVIEDSRNGVLAAFEAGMACIAVKGTKGQDLSKAQVVVRSMRGITLKMIRDPWHRLTEATREYHAGKQTRENKQ